MPLLRVAVFIAPDGHVCRRSQEAEEAAIAPDGHVCRRSQEAEEAAITSAGL
jgi:hypothetical protein